MSFLLITIISFIIIFGILVFVHEFGHFIVAKMSGIMVREFSIGMGPKLFYYRHNHTTYTLRLLPIGGYVRMAGSSDDEDEEIQPGTPVRLQTNDQGVVTRIDLSNKSQLFQGIPLDVSGSDLERGLWIEGYENGDDSEKKRFSVDHDATIIEKDGIEVQIAPIDVQFQSAPLYKRLLVNCAGIFNNVVLAIVAFMLLSFMQGGVPNNSNKVNLSPQVSIAKKAGVQNNSNILAVDGHKTNTWNDVGTMIQKRPDKKVTLTVKHDGRVKNISMTTKSQTVQKQKIGVIGIEQAMDTSFSAKLFSGFTRTWNMTTELGGVLGSMLTHFSLNDLGGPVAIFAETSSASKAGFLGLLSFLAFLSINLAIVNVLPIPALDGGKILLNIVEAIRRKPVSEKTETIITLIGFAIIVVLMVLVTWNDIERYFIR